MVTSLWSSWSLCSLPKLSNEFLLIAETGVFQAGLLTHTVSNYQLRPIESSGVVNVQIPVDQVQSYLEQLDRQKTETSRQNVDDCNNNKPPAVMRSLSSISSYYHSAPAYSSCLMTSPARKSTEDLAVYHTEQLGSCLGQTDVSGAGVNAASECFSAARAQHAAATAFRPVNVHRADSSTCLHSR